MDCARWPKQQLAAFEDIELIVMVESAG